MKRPNKPVLRLVTDLDRDGRIVAIDYRPFASATLDDVGRCSFAIGQRLKLVEVAKPARPAKPKGKAKK